MKTIYFKNSNDPPEVEFKVINGVVAASYTVILYEKNSNNIVATFKGNNLNDQPDRYPLPLPPSVNDGRIISLIADFRGLDLDMSKKFEFRLNVYQDSQPAGFNAEIGTITGKPQTSLMYVKLIMN